jgi:hypothetical protein
MMLLRRRVAKHRLQPPVRRMVALVDISGEAHLLTPDAAAAGVRGESRYIAVCGKRVLPAVRVDPGRRYCWPCRSTTTASRVSDRAEIGSATVNWYPQFEKL